MAFFGFDRGMSKKKKKNLCRGGFALHDKRDRAGDVGCGDVPTVPT